MSSRLESWVLTHPLVCCSLIQSIVFRYYILYICTNINEESAHDDAPWVWSAMKQVQHGCIFSHALRYFSIHSFIHFLHRMLSFSQKLFHRALLSINRQSCQLFSFKLVIVGSLLSFFVVVVVFISSADAVGSHRLWCVCRRC